MQVMVVDDEPVGAELAFQLAGALDALVKSVAIFAKDERFASAVQGQYPIVIRHLFPSEAECIVANPAVACLIDAWVVDLLWNSRQTAGLEFVDTVRTVNASALTIAWTSGSVFAGPIGEIPRLLTPQQGQVDAYLKSDVAKVARAIHDRLSASRRIAPLGARLNAVLLRPPIQSLLHECDIERIDQNLALAVGAVRDAGLWAAPSLAAWLAQLPAVLVNAREQCRGDDRASAKAVANAGRAHLKRMLVRIDDASKNEDATRLFGCKLLRTDSDSVTKAYLPRKAVELLYHETTSRSVKGGSSFAGRVDVQAGDPKCMSVTWQHPTTEPWPNAEVMRRAFRREEYREFFQCARLCVDVPVVGGERVALSFCADLVAVETPSRQDGPLYRIVIPTV